MIMLSPHFTVEELIRSDVAIRKGIYNFPPADVLENLRVLASKLEAVRTLLGRPVLISSGYRCEELERDIAFKGYLSWCRRHGKLISDTAWDEYFATKSHPRGLAADMTCPAFGSPREVFDALRAERASLGYDQLILEFPPDGWVHIGFAQTGRVARGETLAFDGSSYERIG